MPPSPSGTRSRAGIFLVITLLASGGLAWAVANYLKDTQQSLSAQSAPKELEDVVVAINDIAQGAAIGQGDVEVKQWPRGLIPSERRMVIGDVLGRTPRERILAGEVIREDRLANAGSGVGLNAILEPGKRAMTVATNTETAVAGLVSPGNYVDIIVTIKPEDAESAGGKWFTDTILQNIKVLAVGSSLNTTPPPATTTADGKPETKKKTTTTNSGIDPKKLKPSITVEVLPEEAESLALAVSQGDITVVLRSDIDTLQFARNGVTIRDLLELQPTGEPVTRPAGPNSKPAEGPPTSTVTVISGGVTSQVKSDDGTVLSTTKPKRGN